MSAELATLIQADNQSGSTVMIPDSDYDNEKHFDITHKMRIGEGGDYTNSPAKYYETSTIDTHDIFEDSSIVATYQFNDNVLDLGGNYNGIQNNGVLYDTGKFDKAVYTNDWNSYHTIDLNLPLTGVYSASFWIKPTEPISQIFCDSVGEMPLDLRDSPQSTFLYDAASNVKEYILPIPLNTEFSHIVFMFTGSDAKVYLNGVDMESTVIKNNITTGGRGITRILGSIYNNWFYMGHLDQLRIFDKALTQEEVETLYNESVPGEELYISGGPKNTIDTRKIHDIFEDSSALATYTFDGNCNDLGEVYNGTPINISYDKGNFYGSRSIETNGINARVSIVEFPSSINTFSISGWVNINNKSIINALCGGYDNPDYGWFGFSSVGSLTLKNDSDSVSTIDVAVDVQEGIWYHIVATSNSLGSKVYMDGVEVGSGLQTDFYIDSIGQSYQGSNYSNMKIDQLRIFNKALSQEEINILYTETAPANYIGNKLIPADEPDFFLDGSCMLNYKFNGDTLDSMGNYPGVPTNLTYNTGRFGESAVFNGITSRVVHSLLFGTTTTISFWCKSYDLTYTNNIMSSDGDNWILGNHSSWVSVNTTAVLDVNEPMIAEINEWVHIVIIDNGSTFEGYKNGAKLTNTAGYISLSGKSFPDIGYYSVSSVHSLNGELDQFRIFDKALTEVEVQKLYRESVDSGNYKMVIKK